MLVLITPANTMCELDVRIYVEIVVVILTLFNQGLVAGLLLLFLAMELYVSALGLFDDLGSDSESRQREDGIFITS